MQINITPILLRESFVPWEMSNSRANLGDNAGKITWNNSLAQAEEEPLVLTTAEEVNAFLGFVKGSGGWTDEEIKKWTLKETRALFIQWVAADIREGFGDDLPDYPKDWDWEEYQQDSEAGRVASRLFFHADTGQLFFELGM